VQIFLDSLWFGGPIRIGPLCVGAHPILVTSEPARVKPSTRQALLALLSIDYNRLQITALKDRENRQFKQAMLHLNESNAALPQFIYHSYNYKVTTTKSLISNIGYSENKEIYAM